MTLRHLPLCPAMFCASTALSAQTADPLAPTGRRTAYQGDRAKLPPMGRPWGDAALRR